MAGGTTKEATGSRGLDPATPLSLREAALLVGVDEATLEARCDDGSLIYETQRRGRKDVKLVRLLDLADAFPEVMGGEGHADEAQVDEAQADEAQADEARSAAGASAVTVDSSGESMADAVRASGASRDALIGLCQDLETRLDLAERERQASTASLLMAQRRVLDLELQVRSRPWSRAGGAMFGLLSVTAVVLALRAPTLVKDAAAENAAGLRAVFGEELAIVTDQLDENARETAAQREQLATRLAASASAVTAGQRVVEDLARDAQLLRDRTEAERGERQVALGALVQRLVEAVAEARKRAAELDLLVESSSRDRARFAERLAAAERASDDARDQLATERRASADERALFERKLTDILREEDRDAKRQSEELRALREAIDDLLENQESEPAAAEVAALTDEAPESWWTRTLRGFFGR